MYMFTSQDFTVVMFACTYRFYPYQSANTPLALLDCLFCNLTTFSTTYFTFYRPINNTQEAALAIMLSTTHPQKLAEPSLHECTHNKSSATHNLPVTLPKLTKLIISLPPNHSAIPRIPSRGLRLKLGRAWFSI